ncbi:hypothetical protein QE152_g8370 [Popillia japonica]|uniref:Uncharacterized protein n=1 Tax=Popillia japonica TaxID=7064 RepID=A0AAW1MBP1_POPJA
MNNADVSYSSQERMMEKKVLSVSVNLSQLPVTCQLLLTLPDDIYPKMDYFFFTTDYYRKTLEDEVEIIVFNDAETLHGKVCVYTAEKDL